MLRAPLRTLPRRLAVPRPARSFASSTAERRFAVYQSQTTRPVVYASLGLAALFGWTAAVLTVGGSRGKAKKEHGDKGEFRGQGLLSRERSGNRRNARPSPLGREGGAVLGWNVLPAAALALGGAAARRIFFGKLTSAPAASLPSPSSPATSESVPAPGPDPTTSDASQAAAFNPETGEINWDCPCLGGMADGPCGPEFKAAFSCFVYSEAEPKGVDCVEKFRGMQECFRRHPDIYGDEAALQLPDEHFLEKVVDAEERPTEKQAEAAASLE
ncbi:SPOSA6832_02459, partial [Sporobolomyces salmonicolor]